MAEEKSLSVSRRIYVPKKVPTVDIKYGPYASIENAYLQLGPEGDDVISPGLTFGVLRNGIITEYWFVGGVTLDCVEQKNPSVESDNDVESMLEDVFK